MPLDLLATESPACRVVVVVKRNECVTMARQEAVLSMRFPARAPTFSSGFQFLTTTCRWLPSSARMQKANRYGIMLRGEKESGS
jgi:hypothetical protein